MSSWTELSPAPAHAAPLPVRDLRVGRWTRLGPGRALGDEATERTLSDVAERAHAAAQAQGYSVGWAEGRREAAAAAREAAAREAERLAAAEARRAAEHQEAVQALVAAAAALRATLDAAAARVEEQATDVARALTEAIVGREVRDAGTDDVVRRVLALAPRGEVVRVRLHPSHLGAPELEQLTGTGARCVADETLGRLDAVVEVDDHALDLRVTTAVARALEVLG